VSLVFINARVNRTGTALMQMTVTVQSAQQLDNLIKQLKKMPEAIHVHRVNAKESI